jgi:hypothetical protein
MGKKAASAEGAKSGQQKTRRRAASTQLSRWTSLEICFLTDRYCCVCPFADKIYHIMTRGQSWLRSPVGYFDTGRRSGRKKYGRQPGRAGTRRP